MCSDVAGVVESCGPGVIGFEPGDEVCAVTRGLKGGALAEYAVAKKSCCALKPQRMSWELAAAVPSVSLTAFSAVKKVRPASEVLVVGASGGVGQFALALARLEVWAVDAVSSSGGMADAARLGARLAYDYREGLSAVRGVYECILAVNGAYSASDYLRLIKPGGTLVLVGLIR